MTCSFKYRNYITVTNLINTQSVRWREGGGLLVIVLFFSDSNSVICLLLTTIHVISSELATPQRIMNHMGFVELEVVWSQ